MTVLGIRPPEPDKEMENRRMPNLRRKMDNYSFRTQYVPGFRISPSDGISRRKPKDDDSIPTNDWVAVNQSTLDDR